jgi:hypothetical protein
MTTARRACEGSARAQCQRQRRRSRRRAADPEERRASSVCAEVWPVARKPLFSQLGQLIRAQQLGETRAGKSVHSRVLKNSSSAQDLQRQVGPGYLPVSIFFDANEPRDLFFRSVSERAIQPRLAAVSGIAMDDTAFGRLIDCRDKRADLIGIRLFGRARAPLHRPQACHNAAVAQRSFECLTGAFGG